MTAHLTALAAVSGVLAARPLPPGAHVSVNLRHYAHSGEVTVDLDLHETPRALTDALCTALGMTQLGRDYRQVEPVRGNYTVSTYRSDDGTEAHRYGPHFTRQARRTASRADVLRAMA